jgi:hypothetical protein
MRSFTPVRAHHRLIAVLILAPRPPFLSGVYRHHASSKAADLHAPSTLKRFTRGSFEDSGVETLR